MCQATKAKYGWDTATVVYDPSGEVFQLKDTPGNNFHAVLDSDLTVFWKQGYPQCSAALGCPVIEQNIDAAIAN